MRKNYLALQHLYNVIKSRGEATEEDIIKYDDLLNEVENHDSIDDKIFRVRNTLQLTSRKPKNREYIQVYGSCIIKYIVLAFVYLLPIIAVWFLYE